MSSLWQWALAVGLMVAGGLVLFASTRSLRRWLWFQENRRRRFSDWRSARFAKRRP